MKHGHGYLLASLVATACVVSGCASSQPQDNQASAYAAATSADPAARAAISTEAALAMAASGKPKPVWTVPTEEEVASELEAGKYLDATRGWVALKKDGELRFCKRYKEIGSSVARINCLTEAEVRTQVDNMTKYRDDMRNRSGKCTTNVGCGAGF
jgi:hypothetical protein